MTGEDDDLQAGGVGAEDVEDAFLPNGVGIHQHVIEDENLGFVGGEFLRDGDA